VQLDNEVPVLRRPNYLEIDLDAIKHNVLEIRARVGAQTAIFAAVKADAYGFGVAEVAPVLKEAGVNVLAMVDIPDAVNLRKRGIGLPMLLYGGNYVDSHVVQAVEEYNFMVTIPDLDAAEVYSRLATKTIPVFVEVDVGLERLGFPADAAAAFIDRIRSMRNMELRGVYTHMDVPIGVDREYADWQFRRFMAVLSELEHLAVRVPVAMAASSNVLVVTSTMNLSAVDVGKMLYGMIDTRSGAEGDKFNLRSAIIALRSRLTHCKDVRRLEFRDHLPSSFRSTMRIGVVPMGLVDGLPAIASSHALVNGRRVRILGSPSIEHCRLDLTDAPEATVGDEVVFIGKQGAEEIRLDELPTCDGGASPWKLPIHVRETVKRVYRRSSAVAV
jgi:alanine racemase